MPEHERWVELCELAQKEHDPAKLLALTQEINRLLVEKELEARPRDLKSADIGA